MSLGPRAASKEATGMAKQKAAKRASGESGPELQRGLERLDRELVRLLNDRARLSTKLAKYNRDNQLPVWDTPHDRELAELAAAANRGPLSADFIKAFLRDLSSAGKMLAKTVKVAYLGPPYSYSYQAAEEHFGLGVDLAPVGTIAAVFGELLRGHCDYGLVPLENSTDGRVADTLDMFARHPIRITGEVQLRIHHNLLARCPREQIQDVYSKPQALSQCRDWLSKHLPGVRLVEMTSTAAAAQLASEKPGAAAVASLRAGLNYGLNVVAANIEDNRHNVTRFAVIGGDPPRRTGQDKTALMFELPHQPGALSDAMQAFKKGALNLTWIESFPTPGTPNEYLFFVEFEGHESDAKVRRALGLLKRRTTRVELLGSYPRGVVVD